ncbi:hypothetical protein A2911_01055 [Candidatus Nomurabacteria bacterium RIFCSPLOWO2_01_FULL_40_15]|uniref:PPM-type phosphatase domain-containing protein n=1 Tax=Candidatus Nomurabacteria bacterium RIFCSPLOWO2_01_FULL_40_15 TaxID=1801772 RepID=A0A1F6X5U1_9BACT|nr:MAG: hypothetical protein A2911_01055 [Candidatus Nomurabacteria bacterium RIFCSPLOWO2_01_FULL_40_15]
MKQEKKLSEIIAGANKAVYVESMSDSEKRGMGTTGVVLKIHTNSKGEDFAIIANVGDSRLYEINEDGTVTQLTVDDDLISEDPNLSNEEKARISKKLSEFRKKEELSKLEGLFFNQRNIVVRCIGYESDLASILAFPVKRGSRFILTSDGVPGNITTQEIEEAIQQSGTLEEIAEELIKRSLDRSREPRSEEPRAHPDDMSVVVVACK